VSLYDDLNELRFYDSFIRSNSQQTEIMRLDSGAFNDSRYDRFNGQNSLSEQVSRQGWVSDASKLSLDIPCRSNTWPLQNPLFRHVAPEGL
jgi:hypothetical protein